MRKLIGVIVVLGTLVVASFAPAIASASTPVKPETCTESTEFNQPAKRAYSRHWKPYAHHVVVTGSVTAGLNGSCRGFISGVVTVDVRRPNGSTNRRVRRFDDLEFKAGFHDTGGPFTFRFAPSYSRSLRQVGTCVTVTVEWGPWSFGNNEPIPGTTGRKSQEHGCAKVT